MQGGSNIGSPKNKQNQNPHGTALFSKADIYYSFYIIIRNELILAWNFNWDWVYQFYAKFVFINFVHFQFKCRVKLLEKKTNFKLEMYTFYSFSAVLDFIT